MLSTKLRNVIFCASLLLGLVACGQTGDLFLPGSEEAQQEAEEEAVQKSTEEESKN